MKNDVAEFFSKCQVCQQIIAKNQQPGGLLQPLEILEYKLENIFMDFVLGLPKSRHDHDGIWIIIDILTKSTHFQPIRMNYNMDNLATLYMDNVVRLHGVTIIILSDKNPGYLSHFWQSIQETMGTKVTLSTTYHPQTDGQTKKQYKPWNIC